MRDFLRPHQERLARGIVPAARLLLELFAALQDAHLASNLVSQRAAHAADRVHVLDLDLRSEFRLPFRAHRDVAIATQLPLLHVGIAHPAVDQDLLERS